MKKMAAILSLLLISSTSFANVTVTCSGLENGKNINSKMSKVTFLGTLTDEIEEKTLVTLTDGRDISLLLQSNENISKSRLLILVKDKDSKGSPINRLSRGSLSFGVSYSEFPANGMFTDISCNQISE